MTNLLAKKRIILTISALYILSFGIAVMFGSACYDKQWCQENLWFIIETFSPFALVFIFSLVTYRMRQEVFDYWMKFAIWATPLLVLLTYMINGGGSNGLGIESAIGASFDAFLFMILYGLYCGISIWRIFHAYRMK